MARTTHPCHALRRLSGVVLCLLLVSNANADGSCNRGCPQSDNGVLKYTPGNVYEYGFDSILTVSLGSGIAGGVEDTSLKVTGTAKVFAEGNCGYTLQLAGVKVSNRISAVEKKILNNIQKPVHFTLVNGQLEPQICTDPSDTAYALNIKRAIISLLQSGAGTEREVDVFGQCPTLTSSSKQGGADVITKVRSLNNCAYREQINSGLVSGIVNAQAGISSTLLLQADYAKESKIERGIVESVQLVESYKFTATVKGTLDVNAKVVTNLRVKNAGGSPGAAPATGNDVASIIFQKPETYTAKNIGVLKTTLSELVDLTSDYVKKDSAKKFVELIRLLRAADADTLLELSGTPHPNKVLARKVYLDALFRTNTAESARAILKQLAKLDAKEKIIAILSLNLVEGVDKETLQQAAAQLTANAPKELYLAVGSLVSKYCARHGCTSADIEPISKKFADSLKQCKPSTKKDEERIVYVLKGIGNTRQVADNVGAALSECAAPGRSNRIRVAALQAFGALPCNGQLQAKALELLKDHNEDSELRIEAYLAAIECPNAELANEIAALVNAEQVYQVGGFIASNLRAIRDSTDATREQQRYHLANIRVTKQFPRDYRRYSFNNEVSYKLDALGLSASGDYKLIYSQLGFLPRSARLNVTAELFGTNFNVFEASVRQENIENVLEYYVGPKGLLNKDFDEIVKLIEVGNSNGAAAAGGRARRSIADDAAKVAKKYKTYGSKNAQDLNLDLSLKLFGSELAFLSLGDNVPNSLDDIIKQFSETFDKAKDKLSAFEQEFNCHHLFLDTEFAYPTGVGIPLELSAQGFAANKLALAVSIDVSSILEQNWQRAKYRLKLVPSIDVNVNVQLGFNAQLLSSGLRVVSGAHSATGSDVSVGFINEGDGFNVEVEVPREKLELIDVQLNTEFYVAEQDKPLRSVQLKDQKEQPSNVCFNQLEIVGLNLCVISSTGNLIKGGGNKGKEPLARSLSLAVTLQTERKFNFKGTHAVQNSGSQQWKLDFSTPGSKVSHDTSLTFELGTRPRTYGRISFDNPQYNFGLEAGVSNDQRELVIYGQYEQNKNVKRSKIGFVKNGNEYRPVIEIQDESGVKNSINGYRADGKVVVQQTGDKLSRYSFENFQVSNANNERVVVNGWVDLGPSSLNSELRISPGQQSYLVKSNYQIDNGLYAAGLFINDERQQDNVYGASARVTVGNQNYEVKVTGKAVSWTLDSATELQYDKPEGSNTVRSSKFSQQLSVQHKDKPVGALTVKTQSDANKFELDVEVARDQKIGSLNVNLQNNKRSVHDYALTVNGKLNKHSFDLTATRDVNGNLFTVDNSLTTSWGTALSAKGELGQRYTPQDIHINLQGSAQFSGKDKPTAWALKVIGTPEKTNSEFRASRDNAELVKLTAETQHPQDKISAAKVNLSVKNQLTAKGDFKVAKNGKGELTVAVETLKTEPKHKLDIESKFQVLAPKYDIEATLTLDGAKKLQLKTENNLDKQKFSTKNSVQALDKQLSFEATGSVKGDWRSNGEIQGNFVLTAPDGRIVDGSLNRKLSSNAKTAVVQGNMDVQLNEQQPGGGKKRSVALKGKLERLNVKTKDVAANAQLTYTDFEGQQSALTYQIKHQPKGGNSKAFELTVNANSPLLAQPLDVSIVLDEYSEQQATGRVRGSYGSRGSVNVNGNYRLAQANVPASYELQASVQAPETSFKSLELSSHGKLLRPSNAAESNYNTELAVDAKSGSGQFVRLNTAWHGNAQQGSYSLEAQSNQLPAPLKLEGSHQREQTGSLRDGNAAGKQKYNLNASYGDKFVKTAADLSYASGETATLHYTLDSSNEALRNIELELRSHKAVEDTYVISAQAKQSGKSYSLDTTLYRASHKKGVDVRASLPDGQPIVLQAIVELLGERKAKLNLDIENVLDLDFKSNSEASYSSIDDFYLLITWSSKKLQLDNYELDVRAQSKSIKVQLKNAPGVIFSGTASYTLKKEQNKSIIESQGQVQYQGKSQNGNFKLTRQTFELGADKEVGFAYTFNGNFGPKNGVSTIKLTNKEFNTKLSVCEEKKQCTNVQVQSIVSVDEQQLDAVEHSVLILVDLRELGYPYELELKSKTNRQGFKYQYNLDSFIVSGNNKKYQLTANVLPTASSVKLLLPSREIAFESKQQLPTDGKFFGHYEQSAAFYIDRTNRPNDVARISAVLDLTGVERVAINANGQLKLEHPTIRPLSISGRLDGNRDQRVVNSELIVDIFRLPEQKLIVSSQIRNIQAQNGFNITSNQQLKSTGLQLQYELNTHSALNTETVEFSAGAELHSGTSDLKAGAYIQGNKESLEISINGLDEQLLHVQGTLNRQKRVAKINSKLQVFGQRPVEISSELQPTLARLSVKRQDLIDANAELKLGKEFKFDVNGAGKPLFNGRVALDAANFLQTNYKSNEQDVEAFLKTVENEIKQETDTINAKIKQRFEKLRQRVEQQLQLAKDSTPDFGKLRSNYESNAKAILQELENDPSLKPIIEAIRTLYDKVIRLIEQVTQSTSAAYEKLHATFVELNEKLQVLWRDTLLKAWEEFVVAATKLIGQLRVEVVNAYTKALQEVLSLLEKYGPALKNYGKAVNEALKPLNEAAQELIKVVLTGVEELVEELKQYIAKLPTWESLRDELTAKLQELKLVEKALELVNNLFDQLHLVRQTPETTELLQKLQQYLTAKLQKATVNDEQVLEELARLLLRALRSIWQAIESNAPTAASIGAPAGDLQSWLGSLPQTADALTRVPALLSFRTSLINYLLNENWEQVFSRDLFNSWVFFQDFELRGHIVDGQNVFTFDGQHYAYPGTCKLILAQDSVDNNFTVIAQLNNGKLKGIALADRDGNYVEVADNVALKVNGKPVEYPQNLPGIHAWRRFYTVHLHSEYGATVMCTTDLKVCHVHVNGFYTSKTRGLLGNGNAEPYDDYLLVDGTLGANHAALGNDYGLTKCAPVAYDPAQVESAVRADICSELFGLESPLALNYLTLDAKPYRKACDIAVQKAAEKDKESVACTFALAYGSALRFQDKWVLLPPRCLKCAGAPGQRELGEGFSVKIPTNKADVVFVVDVNVTPSVLGSLIAPTITEIRDALKTRGFTDVQIGVVVFDETKRYPALLTSDNGKINYNGNVANVQLNGPKNFCDSNCVEQIIVEKRILDIYHVLERFIKNVVPQSDEKAFHLALDYPFRAGAAKSIVGVRSDSLEYNNWWKYVRAQITGTVTKFDGALLHLIAPVKGLALEGVPAEKLVGFNSRLVATVDGKDNKKRSKLQFDNDMGIDFVLNNGGWVFATQSFDKLKAQEQKKVLNQVTSSIADTLFKTEIVSDCRCLPVYGLHGQHKCSITSSSFVPNKKPKVA